MKTSYDPEVGILSVRFTEASIVESEEVTPGVVFDFDQDGRIVAVEILDATNRLSKGAKLNEIAAVA